jgi:hypothetical protein
MLLLLKGATTPNLTTLSKALQKNDTEHKRHSAWRHDIQHNDIQHKDTQRKGHYL